MAAIDDGRQIFHMGMRFHIPGNIFFSETLDLSWEAKGKCTWLCLETPPFPDSCWNSWWWMTALGAPWKRKEPWLGLVAFNMGWKLILRLPVIIMLWGIRREVQEWSIRLENIPWNAKSYLRGQGLWDSSSLCPGKRPRPGNSGTRIKNPNGCQSHSRSLGSLPGSKGGKKAHGIGNHRVNLKGTPFPFAGCATLHKLSTFSSLFFLISHLRSYGFSSTINQTSTRNNQGLLGSEIIMNGSCWASNRNPGTQLFF